VSRDAFLLGLAFALAALTDGAASRATPLGSHDEGMGTGSSRTVLALHRACQVGADEPESWCEAYLLGVADTLAASGNDGDEDGLCAVDPDPGALAWTFMIWAQAHRDWWNLDMLEGARAALRERWPCR
jgi:hypothetical protein